MPDPLCLIVDHEPAIGTYLSTILEEHVFRVVAPDNATRALKVAQMLGRTLDLIISDINMPTGDMDGVDLAHWVRNAFPSIGIILITGFEDNLTRAAGFELIRKPFRTEAILKAIKRVCPEGGRQDRAAD